MSQPPMKPKQRALKKKKKAELFQVGDTVKVDGKEGIVKKPDAPRGLLGISINGKYALVEPEHATIVTEAMNRLRQLADTRSYAPPQERMRNELHWLTPDEYKEHCQAAYDLGYRAGQNLRNQNKDIRGVKSPHSSFAGQYYFGIGLGDGHDGGPKRQSLPLLENIGETKPEGFIITLEGKLAKDGLLSEDQAMDTAHALSKEHDGEFVISSERGLVLGTWQKGTFTVSE